MRVAFTLISAAALVACTGGTKQQTAGLEPPLKWERVSDGSQIAVGNTDTTTSEAKQLIRCWSGGKGFDCLAINEVGGEWKDARRTQPAALPRQIWADKKPVGYDCSIGGVGSGYQEHINGPLGQLTEHVASSLFGSPEPSWSKDYTDRYIVENQLKPEAVWYDCRGLAKAVQAGSVATVASSSVTEDLLNGKTK